MVSNFIKSVIDGMIDNGAIMFDGFYIADSIMGDDPAPEYPYSHWKRMHAAIVREGNSYLNQHLGKECYFPNLFNEIENE